MNPFCVTMLLLILKSTEIFADDSKCHRVLRPDPTTPTNQALNITTLEKIEEKLDFKFLYTVDKTCKARLLLAVGRYLVWPHRDNKNLIFSYIANCTQTNGQSETRLLPGAHFLSYNQVRERWADYLPNTWLSFTPGSWAYFSLEMQPVSYAQPANFTCLVSREQLTYVFAIFEVQVAGCPEGVYGRSCDRLCNCTNHGQCHTFSGRCLCPPGYTGELCETVAPKVLIETSSENTTLGSSVTYVCRLVPKMQQEVETLRWFLNDGNIPTEASVTVRELPSGGLNTTSLTFDPITEDYQGQITCFVGLENGIQYSSTVNVSLDVCADGFFGHLCQEVCECPSGRVCDWIKGCICPSAQSCDGGPELHIVVAALGGALLVLVAAGLAIFFLCKRLRRLTALKYIDHEQYTAYRMEVETRPGTKEKDRYSIPPGDDGLEGIEHTLLKQWRVEENKLTWGEKLGEGAFCQVYRGQLDWKHHLDVALKIIKDPRDEFARRDLLSEFQTLVDLGPHPNIVQLFGVTSHTGPQGPARMSIVVEYMDKGSLHGLLKDTREALNREQTSDILPGITFLEFVAHVAAGMAYMEGLKIIHRDLAARNILISEKLVAKIGDFGLSRDCYLRDIYRLQPDFRKKLPWFWMSPESMRDNVYTSKSDIWSFGILLWEICSLGIMPYPGLDSYKLLPYLQSGKRLSIPAACPTEWVNTMRRCWSWSPDERPTFGTLQRCFEELLADKRGIPNFCARRHGYVNDAFAPEVENAEIIPRNGGESGYLPPFSADVHNKNIQNDLSNPNMVYSDPVEDPRFGNYISTTQNCRVTSESPSNVPAMRDKDNRFSCAQQNRTSEKYVTMDRRPNKTTDTCVELDTKDNQNPIGYIQMLGIHPLHKDSQGLDVKDMGASEAANEEREVVEDIQPQPDKLGQRCCISNTENVMTVDNSGVEIGTHISTTEDENANSDRSTLGEDIFTDIRNSARGSDCDSKDSNNVDISSKHDPIDQHQDRYNSANAQNAGMSNNSSAASKNVNLGNTTDETSEPKYSSYDNVSLNNP